MNDKKFARFLGWLLISIALGISAYANYHCSFGCVGMWGLIINPLSVIGILLYGIGSLLLFLNFGDKLVEKSFNDMKFRHKLLGVDKNGKL